MNSVSEGFSVDAAGENLSITSERGASRHGQRRARCGLPAIRGATQEASLKGFLTSLPLDGEETAPSACFVVIIALVHALNGKGYNPWDFTLGSYYMPRNNSELLGSFPLRLAFVFVLSGAILIVLSIRSVEKRNCRDRRLLGSYEFLSDPAT